MQIATEKVPKSLVRVARRVATTFLGNVLRRLFQFATTNPPTSKSPSVALLVNALTFRNRRELVWDIFAQLCRSLAMKPVNPVMQMAPFVE